MDHTVTCSVLLVISVSVNHPVAFYFIFVAVQTPGTGIAISAVIFFELLCYTHYVSCHILQMLTIQCELGKRLVMVTLLL